MKRPQSLALAGFLSLVQGAGLTALCALGLQFLLGSSAFAALLTEIVRGAEVGAARFILDHFGDLVALGLLPTMWLIFGLATLVAGLGLLRLQVWAWLGSLVAEGMILAWSLISYVAGRATAIDYVVMLLAVVVMLFLNEVDTQTAMRQQRKRLEERMGR